MGPAPPARPRPSGDSAASAPPGALPEADAWGGRSQPLWGIRNHTRGGGGPSFKASLPLLREASSLPLLRGCPGGAEQ